ncbi:MAG: potassium-transporting ATPase subunit KdpC [Chromatiales bacterium]|jgi:K+-transporting ATPase ATPase C chain|nr:potassium-transporting ATPase subunit KdpC [Chromatiales bacterium]
MWIELRNAAALFGLLGLLTGVVYPLAVTGLAQLAFPDAANGSLVRRDGVVIGSRLVGQAFADSGYFHGRPSATYPAPYNAGASSGSNQATTNPALREAVAARIAALRALDPGNALAVPVDLVTASGSGLDPHISPAAARFQVARVARARGLEPAQVAALVAAHTEDRTLGILGEPRVNVVMLNLALDAVARSPRGR